MTEAKLDIIRRKKRHRWKGFYKPAKLERMKMEKKNVTVQVTGLQLDILSAGYALVIAASEDAQPGKGTNTETMTQTEFLAAMFKRPK